MKWLRRFIGSMVDGTLRGECIAAQPAAPEPTFEAPVVGDVDALPIEAEFPEAEPEMCEVCDRPAHTGCCGVYSRPDRSPR